MSMSISETPTLAILKAQAKRLREAMRDHGSTISHAAALELVARQHGARDWNTLSARAVSVPPAAPAAASAAGLRFGVGDTVSGRYLGQPFTGKVLSLTLLPENRTDGQSWRITVHFDAPVDVVTFDSFSAFRRRINAVIGSDGISPRRTSNGLPHLVID